MGRCFSGFPSSLGTLVVLFVVMYYPIHCHSTVGAAAEVVVVVAAAVVTVVDVVVGDAGHAKVLAGAAFGQRLEHRRVDLYHAHGNARGAPHGSREHAKR